jgi:hypothetical protein
MQTLKPDQVSAGLAKKIHLTFTLKKPGSGPAGKSLRLSTHLYSFNSNELIQVEGGCARSPSGQHTNATVHFF